MAHSSKTENVIFRSRRIRRPEKIAQQLGVNHEEGGLYVGTQEVGKIINGNGEFQIFKGEMAYNLISMSENFAERVT